MFQVLEGRRRRRVISPTTLVLSVGAHLLLLGGVVYASNAPPRTVEVPGPMIDIGYPPPPKEVAVEPPAPVETTPPTTPTVARVPGRNVILTPPPVVPHDLPPLDNGPAIDPAHMQGDGPDGNVFGTPAGDGETPSAGTPEPGSGVTDYVPDADDVEELPQLQRGGLARALERYYPRRLRDAQVEGRVVIELVVNEDGRVRPGSARVLEASHPEFGTAALQVVERFRFTPARMMGMPVPVRVTVPITWSLGG